MKKKLLAAVMAITVLFSFTACGNNTAEGNNTDSSSKTEKEETVNEEGTADLTEEDNQRGGTLIIGFEGLITNLGYPGLISGSNEMTIVSPAVETLCRYDDKGNLSPWLCETYEANADELTLTVTLKKGIKFQDGTDFNAEAVKWNWEQFTATGRSEIASIESIECLDEYTVMAHLSVWNNSIADNALYQAGFMFSPSYAQANGQEAANANPVGTGPYRFVEWDKDIKVVYEAYEDYWIEGRPYMDGIEFDFYSDLNTLVTAYQSGEVDLMPAMTGELIQIMASTGEVSEVSGSLVGGAGINCVLYGCNDETSPTSSLEVRQAIAHAVNWKELCGAIGGMYYTNQWAIPGTWSYNEDVVGYDYNVEKAKELLVNAGYENGAEVNLYCVSASTTIATMIQQYLAQVNITVNIETIDQARSDEMTGIGGGWDGLMLSTGRLDLETASIYERTFTDGGVRFVGGTLHPEELVTAIENAKSATTEQDRAAYSQEASKYIIDTYCMMSPIGGTTYDLYERDYVHDSGYLRTHLVLWTPESCWLSK
ncbi:MAG: ABC transporter substrate-binding protein [Lachnospiraceae bacterium]|nr:ABC transporter substrate-binding protein [Lachnospiraceae bacterium]